ncbi:MAG: hypothetical protein GY749_10310 [Desulfobacteraceae bacterium]|nr:hypothetical protein [Desulfobacteraceae bacterium]
MADRKEYTEKMKEQFDEWNTKWKAERSNLEAKARNAEAGVKKKYEEQIKTLNKKREDFKQKFEKIQGASGGAWEELKEGLEKSWSALKKSFKKAKSHFD